MWITVALSACCVLAAVMLAVSLSEMLRGHVRAWLVPGAVPRVAAPNQLVIGDGPVGKLKLGDSFLNPETRQLFVKRDDGLHATIALDETRASAWFSGIGNPLPRQPPTARPGDHYISDSHSIWRMTDVLAWALQGTLTSGSKGPDGHRWFFDSGAPTTVATAVVGDRYQDTDTGNLYVLGDGGWASLAVSTRGSKGAGSTWFYGNGGPDDSGVDLSSAIPGDIYVDNTNEQTWLLSPASIWVVSASLTGPEGATGADGHRWFYGAMSPDSYFSTSTEVPSTGDIYLDTAAHKTYQYDGTSWHAAEADDGRDNPQTVSFQALQPGGTPIDGDIWFATNLDDPTDNAPSGDVHVYTGGAWQAVGNLKGPDGAIAQPSAAALAANPGDPGDSSIDVRVVTAVSSETQTYGQVSVTDTGIEVKPAGESTTSLQWQLGQPPAKSMLELPSGVADAYVASRRQTTDVEDSLVALNCLDTAGVNGTARCVATDPVAVSGGTASVPATTVSASGGSLVGAAWGHARLHLDIPASASAAGTQTLTLPDGTASSQSINRAYDSSVNGAGWFVSFDVDNTQVDVVFITMSAHSAANLAGAAGGLLIALGAPNTELGVDTGSAHHVAFRFVPPVVSAAASYSIPTYLTSDGDRSPILTASVETNTVAGQQYKLVSDHAPISFDLTLPGALRGGVAAGTGILGFEVTCQRASGMLRVFDLAVSDKLVSDAFKATLWQSMDPPTNTYVETVLTVLLNKYYG